MRGTPSSLALLAILVAAAAPATSTLAGDAPFVSLRSQSDPRGGTYVLPEDFPGIHVSISDGPEDGFLFVVNENNVEEVTNYLIILDNAGFPVFFRATPDIARDFKLQPNGLLTYFDQSVNPSVHRAMDDTYTVVDEWSPQGYGNSDSHDFQLLPNGHALVFGRDWQVVDMSEIVEGGDPNAIVIGAIIQEQDLAKNVIFEWRSWDHYEITDATHIDFTGPVIDYVHFNSCEVDTDGNLIISSRHLDEVTKIDRQTGEIIWRLGGNQNQFTLIGDTQWFSRQHAARRTPAGTLTIYDNGEYNTPQESRAVEYELDETNKIATLIWEFRNTPPLFAWGTGNAQRLPGGNTLISWGTSGILSEVRADGTKAFEMSFTEESVRTYTAFRFPWNGIAAAPYVWFEVDPFSVTLHFAKFGDPTVAQYNVYRGSSPGPTTVVGSTPTHSFLIQDVSPLETLYVRVTADDGMNESPFSNEVEITVPSAVSSPARLNFSELSLGQNRPNPFGPSTRVPFVLPRRALVELLIYDVRGALVKTLAQDVMNPGRNEVVWDGTDGRGKQASSGVYFYRLQSGEQSLTKTMTLRR